MSWQLLEEVYRAAAAPGHWPGALAGVANFVGGISCTLAIDGRIVATGYTQTNDAKRPDSTAWLGAMAELKAGDIEQTGDVTAANTARFHLVGAAGGGTGLSVRLATNAAAPAEAARLFRSLLPHFAAATTPDGQSYADAMIVLDQIHCGIVVLDAGGQVHLANTRALQYLEAAGLTISGGALQGRNAAATVALRRRITAAAAGVDHAEALPIVDGHAALHIALVKLRPGRALAVLTAPNQPAAVDPAALQPLLRLTPAQARLVALLASGLSLHDAAKRLGIAHATATTQVKQAYARTGVASQAALIRLVLAGPLAFLAGVPVL